MSISSDFLLIIRSAHWLYFFVFRAGYFWPTVCYLWHDFQMAGGRDKWHVWIQVLTQWSTSIIVTRSQNQLQSPTARRLLVPLSMYAVSQKTSHFLFLWYLCQISSDFANFWQKYAPGNLKQTHIHGLIHVSFYMFVLYLVKLATHQNAHCNVGRFTFVLSLNRNLATSLKAYLNFWHSNLSRKIYELTF